MDEVERFIGEQEIAKLERGKASDDGEQGDDRVRRFAQRRLPPWLQS
jgi:hypothetical protein